MMKRKIKLHYKTKSQRLFTAYGHGHRSNTQHKVDQFDWWLFWCLFAFIVCVCVRLFRYLLPCGCLFSTAFCSVNCKNCKTSNVFLSFYCHPVKWVFPCVSLTKFLIHGRIINLNHNFYFEWQCAWISLSLLHDSNEIDLIDNDSK